MNYSPLINFLWRSRVMMGREFVAETGETVQIRHEGEADATREGVWLAAEVVVDGERRRGTVAVGTTAEVPADAILQIVEQAKAPVLGMDDRLVTQVVFEINSSVRENYDALVAEAAKNGCAKRVAAMEEVRRVALFTALMVSRLRRKTERIMEIFDRTTGDWNQTFHVLLFQAMGGDRNKLAFTKLAGLATAAMASREKGTPMKVEALLLGAAGFLFQGEETDYQDDKAMELEVEARHLMTKYRIVPMRAAEWDLTRLRPVNHPAVRLRELAALIAGRDFMLDAMLKCRRSEDVEALFAGTRSIGRTKARMVGINLTVPLMFAYGKETGNEELSERALEILTTIPAERYMLLDGWYAGGLKATSAFDSQAMLELQKEFCEPRRCAECRVGRTELNKNL